MIEMNNKQVLTIKQKMVLEAIEYFINENNYPPTIKEICKMLKFKYPNSAFNILIILEKKGYISSSLPQLLANKIGK